MTDTPKPDGAAPPEPAKVEVPAAPVQVEVPAAPVQAAAPAPMPDFARIVADEVAKATKPLSDRLAVSDFAYQKQVNMEQATAALAIQQKFPGMNPDQALMMARMEKPDLFPRIGYDARLHGSTPVSGIPAPMRTPEASRPKTYEEDLAAINAKNLPDGAGRHEREQVARKHFRESIIRAHRAPGAL